MCALFWLNVISCHQSKRRKRSIKVIMGRELVSAFGILFIFPLGNNLYALLWWHIISLFQRAVIKHSKHFLDRTVGLYFCILFESLWAEPTLPPFLLPASLSPSSGGDCTGDRDEWPVLSPNKGGLPGETGLSTSRLGLCGNSVGSSASVLNGPLEQRQILWRVRTWRLKITSQVMSITPIPPARSLCVHGC